MSSQSERIKQDMLDLYEILYSAELKTPGLFGAGIPLEGKYKKADVLYKIKDFCENDKRTADLIKNLY